MIGFSILGKTKVYGRGAGLRLNHQLSFVEPESYVTDYTLGQQRSDS